MTHVFLFSSWWWFFPFCCRSWLSRLPKAMDTEGSGSSGSDTDEGDALHRCLCREVSTGSALLSKVRGDLLSVEKLCKGEAKATNEVRGCCFMRVVFG